MKIVKSNYRKKALILLLLSFGMIFATIGFSSLNFPLNFTSINMEEPNIENDFDYQYQTPKTSEYQNFNDVGENINITLHQSYLNNSFNTALSPSDPNNNSFLLPSPIDTAFNSSYTGIKIEDINAPNKTLNLELGTTLNNALFNNRIIGSFRVLNDCVLQNLSIYLSESGGGTSDDASVRIQVFNSSWSGSRIEPDTDTGLIDQTQVVPNEHTGQWYNYTFNVNLDASNTYNKTFFIYLRQTSDFFDTSAFYHYELDSSGVDNSITYYSADGGSTWNSYASDRDISSQIIVGLNDNTPKPSDINMRINGSVIIDTGTTNSGSWTSTNSYSNSAGELLFITSADWWDVTCNISQVLINFTKTDVPASSSFDISGSGQTVQWNVTRNGGLNYFDSRFSNYQINFTIPNIWDKDTIKVFNGSTPKTSDSTNRSLGNGYREVNVLNAGNGTYWYLTANSTNLLDSMDTYISGIALSIVNHSSIVDFNATFGEIIRNGDLNLSVYSPSPQYLNHSSILDISLLSSSDEFLVSSWDASLDVNQYGIFKIEVSWKNDTAAGLLESYITIRGDTDLTPSLPITDFNASNTFNITVFFEDTGLSSGILADSFTYSIEGGSDRTDNRLYLGSGYYNITIDCNDLDFNGYGHKSIEINANKHYYNNQTKTVQINIRGETELKILNPPDLSVFNSGDTFNITVLYNDTVKDQGIDDAIIEYQLDPSASYKSINVFPLGSGKYNITIDCNDGDFVGYGLDNIIVNASKQFYYNQSESLNIRRLGETSLSSQKIPNKSYYTAAESFNISVYYEDTVKSLGISGANVDVDVDGTIYTPDIFDNGDGYYNISIDCSDFVFSIYKSFAIRINVSLTEYYTQIIILDTLIVGNESLRVLAPTTGAVYIDSQSFDITVEYNDTIKDAGIGGATIKYSLNGTEYKPDNYNVNYIGEGKYNITINVNDADFTRYGFVVIDIDANKQFYENRSTTYTFHRQIRTQITSSESTDLGSIMKGLNVSYTFNYEELISSILIRDANWTQLSSPQGFTSFLQNYGNGTYTMHLDTTNVLVTGSTNNFEFSIYATGNETQTILLTVDVLVIQTEIEEVSWTAEIARNSGLNQTVKFFFNDTTNDLPVHDLTTGNILIKNTASGTPFNAGEFWLFDYDNGTYLLDITMGFRDSGWYTLELNASKFPNYDYSLYNITFYYRGNYTQLNLISYSDPGGILTPAGSGYNFTIFEGSDTTITLNLTDIEYSNNIVLGVADTYSATYLNLVTSSNGVLSNSFQFSAPNHIGTLTTSLSALIPGRYLINLTTSITNYEDTSFSFNLTVIAKYEANLTVIFKPPAVNAGELFRIVILAKIFNGISWIPLQNADITMTPIFDGVPSLSGEQTKGTNSTGQLFFEITAATAITMNLSLELPVEYNHLSDSMVISEINVILPPPGGISFEELLPFIIIIGAALVAIGGSVAVYRGVIVPKKREKQRILTEVKTIFDDAINLEHILVLYKGTGTCIFFKSYGSEQIDPELIGGFLTAVSSFGKEMATQEALNEISYGDKMLLLADGSLIRVALVLGKNASLILRRHLKTFINTFEKTYDDFLPNWRGQLNYFRNAGIIVDDLLNTSIILPHQISFNFSDIKDLKDPHSKEVLKIAQSCCEEAKREFFFIATLLKEVGERTNKDTAEIFMGIKELRDKKILIPIEISALGEQPVSQQEINLINQKVMSLTNLTNEEKQKLVEDLSQLGPVEREAYLSSLTGQQEIVTAPIRTTIGDLSVDNQKAAKKGIKELLKRAKIARDKKNYLKAVEIYQSAALLASNWELTTELLKIQETIRKTRIEDLKIKKANLEKEAKSAVKEKKYLEAATKYKYASKMASEIFKLGVTDMTKEVKRLTNRANEYEKMK